MKKITVLLAEDHTIVREGFRRMLELEDDLEVIGEAPDGRQAAALAEKLRPEVVLMDIAMPLLNGLEATRQVLKALPATKVLMLSAHSDDAYVKSAAAAGAVGGVVRPIGLLLVAPVVIEAVRTRSAARSPGAVVARLAAVAAPVVGAGAYLVWVQATFGDAWLPFRVQDQPGHRGPVTLPFAAMWHDVTAVVHGHHLGSALHVPWVLVYALLLVVAFRRLPLSYAAFAATVLAVSVVSSNLDSFERYALSAFPLVIAASTLTSRRGVERVVLVVAALGMVGYAYLAFIGVSVP